MERQCFYKRNTSVYTRCFPHCCEPNTQEGSRGRKDFWGVHSLRNIVHHGELNMVEGNEAADHTVHSHSPAAIMKCHDQDPLREEFALVSEG